MSIRVGKKDVLNVPFAIGDQSGTLTVTVNRIDFDSWLSHKAEMLRLQSEVEDAKKSGSTDTLLNVYNKNNILTMEIFNQLVIDIKGFADEDGVPIKYDKTLGCEWLNLFLPTDNAFELTVDIVAHYIRSTREAVSNQMGK